MSKCPSSNNTYCRYWNNGDTGHSDMRQPGCMTNEYCWMANACNPPCKWLGLVADFQRKLQRNIIEEAIIKAKEFIEVENNEVENNA